MLPAACQKQNYRKCCSSRPVQAEVTLPVGSGLRDLLGDWLPTGNDFLQIRCGLDVLGFACQRLTPHAGQVHVPL